MNKYFKTIILTTLLLAIGYGIYYYFYIRIPIPDQTGGDAIQHVPPELIEESKAMQKLDSQLPIKTSNFYIVFSYKTGKYMVVKQKSINLHQEFDQWYTSSEFTGIKKDRFSLVD